MAIRQFAGAAASLALAGGTLFAAAPATAAPVTAPAAQQMSQANAATIDWAVRAANNESFTYEYGGTGPRAYDCSGYMQEAFSRSARELPRTSTQQYEQAPTKVPLSQLRPGDLVFSTSNGGSSMYHVALYIGDGKVAHARNPDSGVSVTQLDYINNIHGYAARY